MIVAGRPTIHLIYCSTKVVFSEKKIGISHITQDIMPMTFADIVVYFRIGSEMSISKALEIDKHMKSDDIFSVSHLVLQTEGTFIL